MKRTNLVPILFLILFLTSVGIGAASRPSRGGGAPALRTFSVVDAAGATPSAGPFLNDGRRAPDRERALPARDTSPWVGGRMTLPENAPSDDSLTLVILGSALEDAELTDAARAPDARSWERHRILARAPVAADGTFHVPLPADLADTISALDIDGRYLYLHEPLALEPEQLGTDIALEPDLGGAIRGRLVLPRGVSEIPGSTGLGGYGMHFSGAGMSRALLIEDTLEFELRALQAGLSYSIWANPDIYPGVNHGDELLVEAGQCLELDIQLEQGATVRGQVVNAAGEPVAGAEVTGSMGATYSIRPGSGTTHTDEQGRFELRGLAAYPQRLRAWAEEYLDGESDEFQLTEGLVQTDARIALETGLELGGTVRWPDGAAAAGARIVLAPVELGGRGWRLFERARSSEGSGRTADDGSFRIGALEPGTYALYASLAARDGDRDDPRSWSARRSPITLSTADTPRTIDLELAPTLSCAGRVLDDAGQAIDAFTVTARRVDWPGWLEDSSIEVETVFADAAGRFELGALDPGEWKLSVLAEGYLGTGEQVAQIVPGIDVAALTEPFVLTRTASLSGTLVDPLGIVVVGGEVRAIARSPEGRSGVVETDELGRYSLDSVGPGPVFVEATSGGWAPSHETRLDLEPGERRTGHTLRVTSGGTLEGLVFDDLGDPDPSRNIVLQGQDGEVHETLSDARGAFVVEHLAPGPYQVIAPPDESAWETASDDESGVGDLFEQLRMATANVREGETVSVVLGAPPRAPVIVRGRVTRAGKALAHADVVVIAENGLFLEGMRGDTADPNGRFEVTLDEPGPYTFVVLGSEGLEAEVDFQATIPEVDEYRLDLELPGGSIAGRVRLAGGSSPANGLLWIRREDSTSDLAPLMGGSAISLEDDGSFRIETLHPGRYALSATTEGAALSTLHGVVVRAERETSGVELILGAPGRVAGRVSDGGGNPVEGADVLLRDAQGRILYQLETTTDHDGLFSIERVPAGEVYASARTRELASPPSTAVRVLAGAQVDVDLALRPGVALRVAIEDEAGRPLRATLSVLDEVGHDQVGCLGEGDLEDVFAEGVQAGERSVGPLAPGRYTLRAIAADGRSAQKTVSLDLQADPRLERLQLGP